MPRIQPNATPGAKSQELLAGVKQMLGGTPNIFTTLAHSPSSLGFAVAGFTGFGESKIGAPLREQIALTVANANGCAYCASAHTALAKGHKLPDAELANNLDAKSADPKTQAALTFAVRIVETRGHVSDADVGAVRAAGYDDGAILDLVAITTFNIFTNYINNVVKTDVDFPLVAVKQSSTKAA